MARRIAEKLIDAEGENWIAEGGNWIVEGKIGWLKALFIARRKKYQQRSS